MNTTGRYRPRSGDREVGQLTGTVFFFFFFGEAGFFRTGSVCVCFGKIEGGGAVCAGRVVTPAELSGGAVTVVIEDAVVCGRVTSGVAAAGKAAGGCTALRSCIVR